VLTVTLFAVLALGHHPLDLWSEGGHLRILKVELAEWSTARNDWRGGPSAHRDHPQLLEIEANINFGAFTGWFSRHTGYLTVLSIAALILIVLVFMDPPRNSRRRRLWFARPSAPVGRDLRNLYDRAGPGVRAGLREVVLRSADAREHVWPNFNVADSSILVGVGIILCIFMKAPAPKPKSNVSHPARPPAARGDRNPLWLQHRSGRPRRTSTSGSAAFPDAELRTTRRPAPLQGCGDPLPQESMNPDLLLSSRTASTRLGHEAEALRIRERVAREAISADVKMRAQLGLAMGLPQGAV